MATKTRTILRHVVVLLLICSLGLAIEGSGPSDPLPPAPGRNVDLEGITDVSWQGVVWLMPTQNDAITEGRDWMFTSEDYARLGMPLGNLIDPPLKPDPEPEPPKPEPPAPKPRPRPPAPPPDTEEPEAKPEHPPEQEGPAPPPPPEPPAEPPPSDDIEEPEDSLTGKRVVMTIATKLYPGQESLIAVRFPYEGYVAEVLADNGQRVKLTFGSKTGWVEREHVEETTRHLDYIRLGWQWINASDRSWVQVPPPASGYNVYSPVMYYVGNSSVYIMATKNFSTNITLARGLGYQVWITVQQFGYDPAPRLDDWVVEQTIAHALAVDADGINIDFENMGLANRDKFTAFMEKLYAEAKKHNLVISVDVTRPAHSSWSLCYDRAALAKVSDYVILMAYDEHWAASPKEGSVASLPWTESAIKALLTEVPAPQLILGIPFYTRNWRLEEFIAEEDIVLITGTTVNLRDKPTTQESTVLGSASKGQAFKYLDTVSGQSVSGNTTWYKLEYNGQEAYATATLSRRLTPGDSYTFVSSTALPAQSYLDILMYYNPETGTSKFYTLSGALREMTEVVITFDDTAKQTVVTYRSPDGVLNKIWVEDVESLILRRKLMENYKLAGLAAWSLEWMDLGMQAWNWLLE